MRELLATALIIAGLLIKPCPLEADWFEYQFQAELDERFFFAANYVDAETANFERDENYNILALYPQLSFSTGDALDGYLLADLDWIYDPNAAEIHSFNLELLNAFLNYSRKRFFVQAGLMPFRFGRGMVLADEKPGARGEFQFFSRVKLLAEAAVVLDRSPMASVSVVYSPGFLERIALTGIWFRDEDDAFAAMVNEWIPLSGLRSQGDLYWYGIETELFVGDACLSATAFLESGHLEASWDQGRSKKNVSAWLADLNLSYNIRDWFSVGAFLFAASGDNDPLRGDLGAFVSPMPYNVKTAIFFDPEFADRARYEERLEALTPGGVTLSGVIAPGLELSFQPVEAVSIGVLAATFYPENKPSSQRSWYGWEADLFGSYRFGRRHSILLEAGWFQYGDFFRSLSGVAPDNAVKVTAGYNVLF